MNSILSVSGLFKFFSGSEKKTPILRDVSFSVDEGEFVCVMGPSGSGKSTLLHLIAGLDSSDAGLVELAGENLGRLGARALTLLRRNQIGYVFQFFNLLPNLTVFENVSLPLAIAGRRPADGKEEIEALLERFGIGKRGRAFPHQLSGGEMQRASIARALAGGQPLLLCDEPTGNLSQKAGLEVMEHLRQVCDRDRRTVVLVTHNPRDATFADRVLFLIDGELHAQPALKGPGMSVDAVHEALAALHI